MCVQATLHSHQASHFEKPPIGLKPRWLVAELRIDDIKNAINQYVNADKPVPREWIEELHELLEWYRSYHSQVIEVDIIFISTLELQ